MVRGKPTRHDRLSVEHLHRVVVYLQRVWCVCDDYYLMYYILGIIITDTIE